MSLQVWLPLNGNLDNQGLGNATITGGNSYIANGKIGKAYNASNEISIAVTSMTGAKKWSYCFWGYVVGSSVTNNWTQIARLNDGSSNLRIEVCPSSFNNGIYCYSTHNNAGYIITNGSITSPTGGYYNQWAHFCLTSDGTTITKYMNGIKIGTSAYNGTGAITGTFVLTNSHITYKNDVRIYDHCLSEKEVRETAKGLILHYKLNGNGSGGENLIKNSMTAAPSGYHDYTGKATIARLDSDGTTVTKVYAITFPVDTETYSNYNLYTSFTRDTTKAVQQDGKTYTLSFKVKASKALSAYSFNYEYLAKSVSVNVTTSWQTVQITGVASGNYSALYVCSGQTNRNKINGGILYIADMKLEEGSTATAWSPNPADTEYSSYGYGDNIEWDCSGFNNNGTKTGTIIKDANGPRYDGCYKFNNNSYIEHPALPSMDYATYSFWVKQSSFAGYGMIYGQKNSPSSGNIPWFAENTESAPAWAYFGSNSPNYTKSSGSLLTANTWYHLCYVWNNGIAKWYINGVPNATQVTYTTKTNIPNGVIGAIGDSYTGTSWSGTPFSGNISDFRIYATALSAEDIKELYENKISIDSKENLWAYEFIEE